MRLALRFPGPRSTAVPAVIAAALILAAGTTALAERPELGPGNNNYMIHDGAREVTVTPASTAGELLQCLVGPDVVVTNATLTAAGGAAGTFAGGLGVFGFDEGIVLSSGNISTIVGPNIQDDVSFDNGFPGDPDLDNLIPGFTTFDATILEFDFECAEATEVSFQYVFTSEEYNEWVDSEYNDVFGFFLNGSNIALVPQICSDPGIPVAINNVNCGNPFINSGPNCDCFRNNDLDDGGGGIDTEMDGLTQVFFATAQIQPGPNHIKLAIADAGDFVLDSNVLIRCQTFVCGAAPETGACCFGNNCFILTEDDCVSQGGIYYGDGVPCDPNPCPPVPTEESSWGKIKSMHK